MNNQNLIPNNLRTPEEVRKNARKGGLSRSIKKSQAAKLRWLREKGLKDKSIGELMQIMDDSDISALDQLIFIRAARGITAKDSEGNIISALTFDDRIALMKAMNDWHKQHHGEKIRIDSTSKNLNLELSGVLSPNDIAAIVAAAKSRGSDDVGDQER